MKHCHMTHYLCQDMEIHLVNYILPLSLKEINTLKKVDLLSHTSSTEPDPFATMMMIILGVVRGCEVEKGGDSTLRRRLCLCFSI